jgi:hypothetical protein
MLNPFANPLSGCRSFSRGSPRYESFCSQPLPNCSGFRVPSEFPGLQNCLLKAHLMSLAGVIVGFNLKNHSAL